LPHLSWIFLERHMRRSVVLTLTSAAALAATTGVLPSVAGATAPATCTHEATPTAAGAAD
jgi:hypothetical protein